jgi:hypothetical protein
VFHLAPHGIPETRASPHEWHMCVLALLHGGTRRPVACCSYHSTSPPLVKLSLCLTSALVGGEWSASCPGSLTPSIHWIRGWVGLKTGLDMEKSKILPLPGLELPLLCRPARSQPLYRLPIYYQGLVQQAHSRPSAIFENCHLGIGVCYFLPWRKWDNALSWFSIAWCCTVSASECFALRHIRNAADSVTPNPVLSTIAVSRVSPPEDGHSLSETCRGTQ